MTAVLESHYQQRLLDTFWDMADIFYFKRKDGSEVEKIFVDYWFGLEFTCKECSETGMIEFTEEDGTKTTEACDMCLGVKHYGGEVSNTEEELITNLKSYQFPLDNTDLTAYDVLFTNDISINKTRQRWELFKKYGAFKDGYRGTGNTQGNIIVDVPLEDGGISKTLFSSHTDSVHRTDGFQSITYTQTPETGYIIQSSNDECLGGDDGTGVWLMTKLIEAGVPGRYIFHRAEEVGGRGSGWIETSANHLLIGYDRAIAFDRKSKNSIITYQSCSRGCSDEFADDFGSHLMFNAKRYYLERFQAGDATVMYDVQAPVVEMRTKWQNIKGARSKQVTTTNSLGVKVTKWEVPSEQIEYAYTPKNEFWDMLNKRFQPAKKSKVEHMFKSEEMQELLQNFANETPDEMMKLLDEYLIYKEENWQTDTGGSFTDTANYTDVGGPDGNGIPECTNLSCGYYNAHTQSEYQDYAFLEIFLEGLIATPWETLHTANPPERGVQSWGYTGYRDTYIAPSKTILANATDEEIAEVRRKQASQKERRKKEREEKRRMMDEFGYNDIIGEGYYDEEDDWDLAPLEGISSFWDDYDQRESDAEYGSFYMHN
jgi:hypothetical protein